MATGTGNLPYSLSPVSPFDVITSQAENERIADIESLADGTGIGDEAVTTAKIVNGAVTAAKIETQQAWQSQSLTNGTGTCRYYKDSLGFVHLRGTINISGTSVVLFTLPAGYRPGAIMEFPHPSGGTYGQSSVDTNGVFIKTVGGNGNFDISTATFRAEN